MFEKFINKLNRNNNLDKSEVDYLREHARIKFYKKNELILNSCENPKNVYFILDGCVRLFYNVDGRDKTAFFYYEGNFIWTANYNSIELPSYKNYEAIEDTILVQIDRLVIQKLLISSPNFESIIRLEKEHELHEYQQLIALFITLSPEERYVKLLETNNFLFQRVPQQYIATYIGVSAESLCRIKKRVLEKYY